MSPPVIQILIAIVVVLIVLWVLHRVSQWTKKGGGFFVTVYEWDYGLRYVNGKFDRVLDAGRYFKWPPSARHDVFMLRRTERFETTHPVDATSKDGLVFRMAISVGYRVTDPRQAHEQEHLEKIRMAANKAVVGLAGGHNLQQLLSERAAADIALKALIQPVICGCEITAATIYAIILPPEVRRLFTEIERAKLEGLAALERARGENASLRSLANAAGMLKDNPALMNLRLLQSMATGKSQLTVVLGKDGTAISGEAAAGA
jgi:regulator of protease activity HflC (stomatin/prohibitin superfamily)